MWTFVRPPIPPESPTLLLCAIQCRFLAQTTLDGLVASFDRGTAPSPDSLRYFVRKVATAQNALFGGGSGSSGGIVSGDQRRSPAPSVMSMSILADSSAPSNKGSKDKQTTKKAPQPQTGTGSSTPTQDPASDLKEALLDPDLVR